jgi:hypothetical protein
MPSRNGQGLVQEIVTVADLAALTVMSEGQILRLTTQGVFRRARNQAGQFLPAATSWGKVISGYIEHLRDSLMEDPNEVAHQVARASA